MTLELLHSVLTSTNRFLFFLNLLRPSPFFFFFFNDPPPTEIYPLPLHAALPFSRITAPSPPVYYPPFSPGRRPPRRRSPFRSSSSHSRRTLQPGSPRRRSCEMESSWPSGWRSS